MLAAMGCLKSKDDAPPPAPPGPGNVVYDWGKIADSGFTSLNNYYWQAGEEYFTKDNQGDATFHYWWNAHALDALTDSYIRKPDNGIANQMAALVTGLKNKNNGSFINDFYDDMEWLALSCLRAYSATNNELFRETAQLLWTEIKGGWNSQMGGGIAWRKSQTYYKNTPANAPAAILGARMYALTGNADDLEWAKKIYTWLVGNLLDNSSGLVWDGINRQNDGKIDKDWKFTYNQGVFIGAALELYLATNDEAFKSAALRTANFATTDPQLAPSGILKNENQGDGGLFKGILVRYLTEFAIRGKLSEGDRDKFATFLETNAKSLWSKATLKPQNLFGSNWTAMPASPIDMSTHLSGQFLMEAMARMKKEGLIE
jgi:predicted alpha-1,6-mannanase (GH76 family)